MNKSYESLATTAFDAHMLCAPQTMVTACLAIALVAHLLIIAACISCVTLARRPHVQTSTSNRSDHSDSPVLRPQQSQVSSSDLRDLGMGLFSCFIRELFLAIVGSICNRWWTLRCMRHMNRAGGIAWGTTKLHGEPLECMAIGDYSNFRLENRHHKKKKYKLVLGNSVMQTMCIYKKSFKHVFVKSNHIFEQAIQKLITMSRYNVNLPSCT